ncbi:MAG: tetratricopeptide repeat protein [Spirochaetaceae bacterium]|nr:tetratricopeptide repeat protein [Spirochaetaceae bacterium]
MKIRRNQLFVIFLIITIFLIIAGCRGAPKEIPENLYPEEYFKNAQIAMVDWGNYKAALFYYEEFIKKFPDMQGKIIEAEYEIAFIHYRRKNYIEAEQMFESILDKYKTPESAYYNEWPRVLSEKILAKIRKKMPKSDEI